MFGNYWGSYAAPSVKNAEKTPKTKPAAAIVCIVADSKVRAEVEAKAAQIVTSLLQNKR